MPDSSGGSPNKPKFEFTTEMRLLTAFILMGAVLFLTPYFFRPQPAPQQAKKNPAPTQAAKPAPPPKVGEPAVTAAVVPGAVAAEKDQLYTVETALFKVVFANRGAVVRSWVLKNYMDAAGKPVDVVNSAAANKVGYPLALWFKERKPNADLDRALYKTTVAEDGLSIAFEWSNGRVAAKKSLRFAKASYLTQIESTVTENGQQIPHLLAWRGGFGDASVPKAHTLQHVIFYDTQSGSLTVNDAGKAKDGPVVNGGQYSFAGIEDAYFAAVFLPEGGSYFEVRTLSDPLPPAPGSGDEPHVGTAIGGEGQNRFSLFVGPKDLDILRAVNPKLAQVVDFGWFAFLAKPLFLALNWTNDNLTRNYGWAIILVTIAINFLLFPLKISSFRSMKKMSALQPQIQAINEKYKNVGIRDPKKAEQNQEIMDLYKKNSVNPAGGCLPMLLQIPFFFAFYKVLTVAVEMRGADWLWISDLAQPEALAIRPLPLLMIATQFVLQKMTPSTSMDPAQQRVMLLMPLMFGFMFYGVSSGLVLYWLTGNVIGIVQQWFFNRTAEVTVTAPPAAKNKKRK
ncbi:MAG: membrane protein insertase YidC [Bryobacteraceae bacterium]|nr:membrane protein insertase YidC [Bryobacteraceae bacterium]